MVCDQPCGRATWMPACIAGAASGPRCLWQRSAGTGASARRSLDNACRAHAHAHQPWPLLVPGFASARTSCLGPTLMAATSSGSCSCGTSAGITRMGHTQEGRLPLNQHSAAQHSGAQAPGGAVASTWRGGSGAGRPRRRCGQTRCDTQRPSLHPARTMRAQPSTLNLDHLNSSFTLSLRSTHPAEAGC